MPKYFKKHLLSNKVPKKSHREDYDDYIHPDDEYYDPVRTLLEWTAPSRPFRKKDRSYYTTAGLIIILCSLIALIAGQIMLVITLLAFFFLVYVINSNPPEMITYKLTVQGVTIGDHFYHWQELDSFWFKNKEGYNVLHILKLYGFPGELMLILGDIPEEIVKRICARFIPFHEIAPKTLIEKWAESLQKHFPLETPHH